MRRRASELGRRRVGARTEAEDEIRHHLEERVDLLVERGLSADEALVEARRRFGDPERLRDEMLAIEAEPRGTRCLESLRALVADGRHALRGLAANATFTVAVIATIALGIGAAAAIFAVGDALLLRPLPFADAERWVAINQVRTNGSSSPGMRTDRIATWQEATDDVFDAWLAFLPRSLVRTDGEGAEQFAAVAVQPGAERLLGIPVALGRGFTDDDGAPGAPMVLVLGHEYWKRLGADPAILGTVFQLDAGRATVVGVLGPSPKFPPLGPPPQAWIPLRQDFTAADGTITFAQWVWARVRPGVTPELAQARMDALAPGLNAARPERTGWEVRLMAPDSWRANPDVRRALGMLGVTGVVIFLIALVNGANLLLIRASVRARELALRVVLGASRLRLLRLLLAEGVAFGLASAAAAVVVAWGAVALVRGMMPDELIFGSPFAFTVETRTLVAIVAASTIAGLVLGLAPSLQLRGIKGRYPGASVGSRDDTRAVRWARGGMVVAQVALSTALLVGAGLLVHSMVRLLRVDAGIDVERLAIADLALSPARYADDPARADFARRVETALEERPEIEGVAGAFGSGFSFDVELQAESSAPPADQPAFIPFAEVGADWFETVGARVTAGRSLGESDGDTDNVVVDRDLARFLWGAADPVGRRFRVDEEAPWLTVVGVVEELRLMGRDQRRGPNQLVRAAGSRSKGPTIRFYMRTRGRPEAVLPVFEDVLRSVDPEQPYWYLRTAADALAADEEKPRFLLTLMAALAGLALVLATVGLYGVLAYSVERRRREFGVRIALGAGRGRVLRLVLGAGWSLAFVGAALGLGVAWAAGGFLQPLLFEVDARDALTAGVTIALMLATATLASLLPALRATSADPVEALRAD